MPVLDSHTAEHNHIAGSCAGENLPPGQWFSIDQSRINQFADVTEDHQFIHTDPEQAKATDFGGTIAHGFLSLSLLTYLSQGSMPLPENFKMGMNYGFDKIRFLNPVRPGDEIRFCATVISMEDKGDQRYLQKLAVTIEIKGQSKPALVCEWLNLFVCE